MRAKEEEGVAEASADDVLAFFRAEENLPMEAFLTSILAQVADATERKRIAVIVLSQAKLTRLQQGRPIVGLLELERRLLAE